MNLVGAAHKGKNAKMNFTDLNWDKREYNEKDIFDTSKLALMLFTKELAKRTEGRYIEYRIGNRHIDTTSMCLRMSYSNTPLIKKMQLDVVNEPYPSQQKYLTQLLK